jgi:hypothetical protein
MLVKPSRRLRKHLEANGQKAKATVLEIAGRGWNEFRDERGWDAEHYNADPMRSWCRRTTRVRVQPAGAPEFEVEAKLTFRLASLPEEPGVEIDVIYDPAQPSKIMVDDDGQMERVAQAETDSANAMIAAAGYDPADVQKAIEAAQAAAGGGTSELVEQAFESARRQQAEMAADPQGALRAMQEQQLEQLAKLRERGMMSQEDFESARSRLLGEG